MDDKRLRIRQVNNMKIPLLTQHERAFDDNSHIILRISCYGCVAAWMINDLTIHHQ